MDVSIKANTPHALALLVGLSGSGASRRVVMSAFWEDGEAAKSVYHDGDAMPLCPGSTCRTDEPGEVRFSVGDDRRVRNEYLVLTWGATASTRFERDRPGWRVREVAAPPVRRITAVATGTTGASTGGSALEHYEGMSASGGARGSLVWVSVPCDGGGYGAATLAAAPVLPGASRSLSCLDDGETEVAAVAPRAVRWTVTGRVVGVSHEAPVTRAVIADIGI